MKNLKKKKLLMVDDDVRALRSQSRNLERSFKMVLVAHTVEEAISLIDNVDVVMTDWQMLDGGGEAVIDACQERNKPVFVQSGVRSPTNRVPCVVKGCEYEDIISTVKQLLA